MHKKNLFVITIALMIMTCSRVYKMDDFLFEPTTIDEYLRPEDFEEEWCARFIIPDSLITPVTLTSMGNSIYGFFVKGCPDSAVNNQVTILFCHGNAMNINRYWARIEYFWEMGYNAFIFDYQGYGKSEGSPSGEALFSDGNAALVYLQELATINDAKIAIYGMSLGSFVTTYLAADVFHPAAVILEAAPASIEALLRDSGLLDLPGSYVAEADFDNVKRINKIGCPLFMLHSKDDDYIVFDRHAPLIWNKAVEPKEHLWVEDALHDNLAETLGNTYHNAIIGFINEYVQ